MATVFPRCETYSVLVLRLACPCYKCVFDFFRELLVGNDIRMGWLPLEDLSGGWGSAGGGDVVALAVEVMLDGGR